jgi:hypothetical protein
MNDTIIKEKVETTDENSNEIMNGITDAPEVAETETEVTSNPDNKEAEMADKKDNSGQDLVEDMNSDLGKSAGAEDIKESVNKDTSEEAGDTEIVGTLDEIKQKIENELGPNVTLDPQNEEQLDLNLMKDPIAVSKISVPTDDDQGEFLDATETVKAIRKYIDENKSKTGDELKDPEFLKTGTELLSGFNKKLSLKEMLTLAVLTKNYLLYGMALIILKNGVKEDGQNWIYYYKKHFIPSTYSSAIKYMKLARIPNVIRYAFLGLQRLEKIHTAIKDDYGMEEGDPIGEFFKDNTVNIDLNESEIENFKYEIDVALAKTKLKKFFDQENEDLPEDKLVKNTVDLDLIDELIRKDKKIEEGLMKNLYLFAKGGSNPNVLIEDQLKGGSTNSSKKNRTKLTHIKTIEGFPKIISELKLKVAYFTKNTALLKKVAPQHIKDLQDQVTALKTLIKAQTPSK